MSCVTVLMRKALASRTSIHLITNGHTRVGKGYDRVWLIGIFVTCILGRKPNKNGLPQARISTSTVPYCKSRIGASAGLPNYRSVQYLFKVWRSGCPVVLISSVTLSSNANFHEMIGRTSGTIKSGARTCSIFPAELSEENIARWVLFQQ